MGRLEVVEDIVNDITEDQSISGGGEDGVGVADQLLLGMKEICGTNEKKTPQPKQQGNALSHGDVCRSSSR